MSEVETPATPVPTPAPETPAEPPAPEKSVPAESEPPPEPPAAAKAPEEDLSKKKLLGWSAKLSRKEQRIKQQRAEFEADRQKAADALAVAQLFDGQKIRPVIEAYAKRRGISFQKAYDTLTAEALNPDQPSVEELVEKSVAEREKKREELAREQVMQHQQARINAYAQQAEQYVATKLPTSEHEYLKSFDAQQVARFAVQTVLHELQRTGQEIPLDKVLADMNAAEKVRYEKHQSRLRPPDPKPSPERGNGTVQPVKPEARKRGSSLNNIHAAQPIAAAEEEDLSNETLSKKAANELRRLPGWH